MKNKHLNNFLYKFIIFLSMYLKIIYIPTWQNRKIIGIVKNIITYLFYLSLYDTIDILYNIVLIPNL